MAVVIPDAADYGTPVPRASGGTAPYRVAEAAQIDAAPWLYAGNAAAKATGDIGGELDKWGLQIETTQAQDALNQLRNKRQELTSGDNGFLKVQGKGVLDKGADGLTIYEKYPAQLQTSADDIGSKLMGARARDLYKTAAAAEVLGYKSEVAKHGITETEKYQAGTYKDTNLQLTNRALEVADDPKALEAALGSIERSTLARAAQLGIPGEGMAKGAVSDVVQMVIKRSIATGDSAKAISTFDKYGDRLDAKDRLAIEQDIKTLRVGETAREQAQGFLDNTYNGRTRAYESGGGMVSNGLGSGAFGPYQFMPATWAALRAKNPGLDLPADMTKATREQHDAAHEQFKADNAASLRASGLEATPANLYLAHRFGAEGAAAVLKANPSTPLSSVLPANWQDQNPDMKGQTAGSFRAFAERRYAGVSDAGVKVDPLQKAVDAAGGVAPPKSGPRYTDTRQMLLDADTAYDAAMRQNSVTNAHDDAQFRATKGQLDLALAASKRNIETAKLDLEMKVDNWMQTGGPNGTSATSRPPPEIWNQLHYEKQKSIDATIAHNLKGADAVTDQQVWYQIQKGLSSEDPMERNRWANQPLWEYKDKLSNSDFQELAKLQGAVRKGDPEKQTTHIRTANQMIDDVLNKLGIDPTPKPSTGASSDAAKSLKFRRAVQDKISAIEAETGKKATIEQQEKVIDSMAMDIVTKKGILWDSSVPRYQMTIKDVPDAEKAKIGDALKRRGMPVTDETIVDIFARKNAKTP